MVIVEIQVDCYAGYRSDERPVRFRLGARTCEVTRVEDRWYGPEARYFRVQADDGHTYVLRHDENSDTWTLDAFRAGPGNP